MKKGPPEESVARVPQNTLLIRGTEIPVATRLIEQSKLRFFPENPRIYSIVRTDAKEPSQEDIEEQLLLLDHVRELVIDIRQNGGLTDPVIVKDQSFEVLEGNSRLAAYRHLAKNDPVKWARIKCTVLPANVDEALLFALLGQYHIKGKKDWAPYEQAGFLYRRFKNHKVDMPTLAAEIGLTVRKVKHLVETYQFMLDHAESERDRWSYYDEYLKSPKIRKARQSHAGFDELIVEKIRSEEIPRAVDVRDRLPLICSAPKILKKFVNGTVCFDDAHDDAVEAGGDSSALNRITAFRKWLVSDKADQALQRAHGQARDKVVFELTKIHSRSNALKTKLQPKQ